MIKYALACENGHQFESWFAGSDAFEEQVRRGFVTCPVCDSARVAKQLMAPSVARRDRTMASASVGNVESGSGTRSAGASVAPTETDLTAQNAPVALLTPEAQALRLALSALHQRIVAQTEDVGRGFADEARRIHYGEVEDRSIRGQASLEEARDLVEEGIGILPVPVAPDAKN